MSKLTFLRKPLRLILIAVLMALISTAMLFFCLQSFLDGLVMKHSMNSTAYLGTIYGRLQEYPLLKDIPLDILQQLERSDTVENVMAASVYSARAEGLTYVADGFGNNESLNMKLMVEGIVASPPALSPGSFGMMEKFELNILSIWGGIWPGKSIMTTILRDFSTEAPQLKEGDHVFLVGRYNSNADGYVNGMLLFDPEMLASLEYETDSAIWNHSILLLSPDRSKEECDAFIHSFLLETGLDAPAAMMEEIRDLFTVNQVEEMSMLLTVADETTFMTEGREISANDIGSRVCVINEAVAKQNGLAVGDTIHLSIADGCYSYDSDFEGYVGWKSGYPFEGDRLLAYQGYGEFQIIGLYSEINRNVGAADYSHYTRNDIFIPSGILPDAASDAQARSVTFRVLGPNYEDFMNEFEVSLNEQGYTLNLVDTGWESMSSSFYTMRDRRAIMVACAIVALLAAILSFDVLLSSHFRYEYALCRLLGAMPGEARESLVFGFMVTAIPAGVMAVGCSFAVYHLWLKAQAAASLPTSLPADGTILAYLAGWACLELMAVFAVLMAVSFITRRQNLIRLLK